MKGFFFVVTKHERVIGCGRVADQFDDILLLQFLNLDSKAWEPALTFWHISKLLTVGPVVWNFFRTREDASALVGQTLASQNRESGNGK
jgi:hypothetical protein